jgi:hypothetical protein
MAINQVQTNRSPTNLEDTMLIAFLVMKGHKIKPWQDTEDKDHVSFDILGDQKQINEDIESFYSNEQVGVHEYVKCLKEVKSQMYSFKKTINKN